MTIFKRLCQNYLWILLKVLLCVENYWQWLEGRLIMTIFVVITSLLLARVRPSHHIVLYHISVR